MDVWSLNPANDYNSKSDPIDLDPMEAVHEVRASQAPIKNEIDESNFIDPDELDFFSDCIGEEMSVGITTNEAASESPNTSRIKTEFYLLDPESGDGDSIDVVKTTNLQEIAEGIKNQNLLVRSHSQNGQENWKAFGDAAQKIQEAKQINVMGPNGQRQRTIDTKDIKVFVFTEKDIAILTNVLMAAFAVREARRRIEQEKKDEEDRKRKEAEQLGEALRKNHSLSPDISSKKTEKPQKEKVSEPTHNGAKHTTTRILTQQLIQSEVDEEKKAKLAKKLENTIEEMVTSLRQNILKKDIEKSTIRQDEVKRTRVK